MLITIKQKFNILNKLKRFSKSLQKQWTIKFIPRFYTGKVVARKKDFNIFFVVEGRSAVKIFGIKWRYYYCLKATLKIQILHALERMRHEDLNFVYILEAALQRCS